MFIFSRYLIIITHLVLVINSSSSSSSSSSVSSIDSIWWSYDQIAQYMIHK